MPEELQLEELRPKKSEMEQPEEESEEESDEQDNHINKISVFFSPEGVIMMTTALFFDVLDLLWLGLNLVFSIGEIPSFISSIIAIIIFGLWALISHNIHSSSSQLGISFLEQKGKRKKGLQAIKKATKSATKKGTKTLIRYGVSFLGEIIPFLGTLFFWTWFVSAELKQRSK